MAGLETDRHSGSGEPIGRDLWRHRQDQMATPGVWPDDFRLGLEGLSRQTQSPEAAGP